MFGNIQKHKMKNKPLSREFLLNRGFCCGNGCLNCPYMENKTKKDLIERVVDQIKEDLTENYVESVEGLLEFLPPENLIEFLPEEEWDSFQHLKN